MKTFGETGIMKILLNVYFGPPYEIKQKSFREIVVDK